MSAKDMQQTTAVMQQAAENEENPVEALRDAKDGFDENNKKGAELALEWFVGERSLPEVLTGAQEHAKAKHPGDSKMSKAAQSGTVLQVVTVGVISIIGILIYSQIQTSLPTPENTQLANSTENVTDGFADAMNLLPVVFVVLVAALVIAVVQRFRG